MINANFCKLVQDQSHVFLSVILLLLFVTSELYLSILLQDNSDDYDKTVIILYVKGSIAVFEIGGLLYTGNTIDKDHKLFFLYFVSLAGLILSLYYGDRLM